MKKLHITNIRMYNQFWYAIKFAGSKDAFIAMTSHLRGYTKQGAYYQQGEFDGTGAWIVRADLLERYADRFHDYELKTTRAQRAYEQERGQRA